MLSSRVGTSRARDNFGSVVAEIHVRPLNQLHTYFVHQDAKGKKGPPSHPFLSPLVSLFGCGLWQKTAARQGTLHGRISPKDEDGDMIWQEE